jgi:hypothetical protein
MKLRTSGHARQAKLQSRPVAEVIWNGDGIEEGLVALGHGAG